MATILHLAESRFWQTVTAEQPYERSTLGATLAEIGFIHCAAADQVETVASNFYGSYEGNLTLLIVDVEELAKRGANVKWENVGNGDYYPHIYGELLPTDVLAAIPVSMVNEELQLPELAPFAVLKSSERPPG